MQHNADLFQDYDTSPLPQVFREKCFRIVDPRLAVVGCSFYSNMAPSSPKRKREENRCDSGPEVESSQVENLKKMYYMEFPKDFFDLWKFVNTLDPVSPCDALKTSLGVQLVGPFEVLAGKFDEKPDGFVSHHLHYRYFYDPPEFITVMIAPQWGFHWGYFRDHPDAPPSFVARASNTDGCDFTVVGSNIFSALVELGESESGAKSSKKRAGATASRGRRTKQTKSDTCAVVFPNPEAASEMLVDVRGCMEETGHEADLKAAQTARRRAVIGPTFNGMGIVVPYNPKTEVGYRPVYIPAPQLKTLLKKIEHDDADSGKFDELVTMANISNDECDFGMSLELGLDLFTWSPFFQGQAQDLLTIAYMLLGRSKLGDVLQLHLQHRGREQLSQLVGGKKAKEGGGGG